VFRAALKISEGSGGAGPAIGCTVGVPLIEVGSAVESSVFTVLAGEAKGAGGLSMAAQNAREGRGLDSEQAVELMKG
jgi:hypothetical protein